MATLYANVVITKILCLVSICALLFLLRAYFESLEIARWYKRQYNKVPRVNPQPQATRLMRIINALLFIPKY